MHKPRRRKAVQPKERRGANSTVFEDNGSAVGRRRGGGLGWMRQLAESTPGGWPAVALKFGPAWVLVGYLMFFLTGVWDTNLSAIAADARAIRSEHLEMSSYLRGICMGVNRDEVWRCASGEHGR